MKYCPLFRLVPVVLLLAACGSTSHADLIPHPVAGMPSSFVGPSRIVEAAGAGCRNPLRDPDRGVTLTMIRSGRDRAHPDIGWGDYAVSPAGSYGLRPDQLLRVECGSGKPTGVVPQ